MVIGEVKSRIHIVGTYSLHFLFVSPQSTNQSCDMSYVVYSRQNPTRLFEKQYGKNSFYHILCKSKEINQVEVFKYTNCTNYNSMPWQIDIKDFKH